MILNGPNQAHPAGFTLIIYYPIFKAIFKATFWVYYGKQVVTGVEHIPKTGPVILACNHPNSFLDAILVGSHIPRRVHFLARSDVFNTPLKMWILTNLNMIPIYRLQEGIENLDKNKDTFNRCHELFERDGLVLIFSEGICVQEMRLRPLKKGTARIAFDYAKEGASIKIVAVGSNYMKPTKFREEVLIGMAPSFDANEFSEQYTGNKGKAINGFNKKLEGRFLENVINVQDKANEVAYGQLLEVMRNDHQGLETLVNTVGRLNYLRENDTNTYLAFMKKVSTYQNDLRLAKITDGVLLMESPSDRVIRAGRTSVFHYFRVLFFNLGYALHGLPIFLAKQLTTRNVKRKEFYDSVLVGSTMILHIVYLLWIFLAVAILKPLLAIGVLAVLILAGYMAVKLYDWIQTENRKRAKGKIDPFELQRLLKSRQEIKNFLETSL